MKINASIQIDSINEDVIANHASITANALREMADYAADATSYSRKIFDANGNSVGSWSLSFESDNTDEQ